MQNSRLGRMGKETLKNRSNFTLLQQINPLEFSSDQPIKNTSTLYLDENGKQAELSQLGRSNPGRKIANREPIEQEEDNVNQQDMYALPVVNGNVSGLGKSGLLRDSGDGGTGRAKGDRLKMIKSQYMRESNRLDSVKEQSQVYGRTEGLKKSLLSIKRPKGFTRRPKNFQQIDFIGDNLYQVQDIISDIVKIIDHTKTKNIITATKQPKAPQKTNKWLSNNYGLSKLDQMLMNYRTTPDEMPALGKRIQEEFYRESTYEREGFQREQEEKEKEIGKSKMNAFNAVNKLKNNQKRVSLAVVKWNQLPMIGAKWQPSVYLKLQSYPQQDEYRKVVLKAYSSKIKSYSIFSYPEAGLLKPQSSNDKNLSSYKLMSQQQYAKAWQQKYPSSSQQLSEQQKQLLMEFDIEWYRSLIELCYHSGLEDLLEKQYDVMAYIAVLKEIAGQEQEEPTGQLLIQNQLLYLREYFSQVYHYGTQEIVVGLIRINNDEKMGVEEVYENFKAMLAGEEEEEIEFSMWPLKEDNSSLVVLLPLNNPKKIIFDKQHSQIHLQIQNPASTLTIKKNLTQPQPQPQAEQPSQQPSNSLLLKQASDNDWQLNFKLQHQAHQGIKYQINMVEELLFGLLYGVDVRK